MKKDSRWIVVALILFAVYWLGSKKEDGVGKGKSDTVVIERKIPKPEGGEVSEITSRIGWTRALRTHQIAVCYFGASWCSPCTRSKPYFKSLAQKYTQAKFYSVDVDSVPSLQRRHGIEELPTFVVFLNGREEGRQVGFPDNLKDVKERLEWVINEQNSQ